jgi:hypothetical protein
MKSLKRTTSLALTIATLFMGSSISFAKLPDPSPEAKAASALTAAKNAHNDKISAFQLCLAQDKVAKKYASKPQAGEKAIGTPACKDPGKFEPPAELVAATASAPVVAVAPNAPVAPVKK